MTIEQIKNFVQRGAAAQRAADKIVTAPNALTVARKWGAHPPAWILALAEECDRSSQGKAAKRLGVSTTVVNQALQNLYEGRLDRFEQRVRGELMRETV